MFAKVKQTRKIFKKKNVVRLSQTMKQFQSKEDQIIHCVSQLRRFSHCFFENSDYSGMLQFGYNLGRLQELCLETNHPEIWWSPIEKMVETQQWGKLFKHIDLISGNLGIEYDTNVLRKGC